MRDYEFEKRLIISKEKYDVLLMHFSKEYPNHKVTKQINYYFDTLKSEIQLENECLRVRTYHDDRKTKFTYKTHDKVINGDEEIYQILTVKEEMSLLQNGVIPEGQVKEALNKRGYQVTRLKFVGDIHTDRLEIFEKDYIVVLDKNTYSGITDYNIEIESTSIEESEKVLKEICNSYSIEYRNDTSTKSKRAIEAYKKKQGI